MAAPRITARDVAGMTQHWLGCPPNGYLGSGYGSDLKSLLQNPLGAGLADGLIAKCRQDVPLLLTAPPDMVNVYAETVDIDKQRIVFEVGGELVDADGGGFPGESDPYGPGLTPMTPWDYVSQASAALLDRLLHVTLPFRAGIPPVPAVPGPPEIWWTDGHPEAEGWPGTFERAMLSGGVVIPNGSAPWTWENPDLPWNGLYAFDGHISYQYTVDMGAARQTWVRVFASTNRPVIVERSHSTDGSTWTTLVETGSESPPIRFSARYVRVRIIDTGDGAAISAARVLVFQQT